MECKGCLRSIPVASVRDLIETLWNVKFLFHAGKLESVYDLIETLWNVKLILQILAAMELWDLIETLWNVKGFVKVQHGDVQMRFNRDIVECKEAKCRNIDRGAI